MAFSSLAARLFLNSSNKSFVQSFKLGRHHLVIASFRPINGLHHQLYCSKTILNSAPPAGSTGIAQTILNQQKQEEKKEEPKLDPEEEKKKKENAVRALKYTLLAFGTMFVGFSLYSFFVFGAPLRDKNGNPLPDEFSELPFFQQYFKRAMNEVQAYITYVTEPSRDKLLPDPLKHPYIQPPYTVLIELTGILVYPDWTYKTGWRFKKRPGVDFFLSSLATHFQFEIVVYTAEQGFTAFPIIDALDTQNVVAYRLFRDSTKYTNGIHEKDLDRINRDLKKTIVIDCNENAVKHHRNNAIVLPKWQGNDDDRVLFDLANLLQTISSNEIDDVRVVLEHYSNFQDPILEFRQKQKQFLEAENQKGKKEQALKQSPLTSVLSPSHVLSFFRGS